MSLVAFKNKSVIQYGSKRSGKPPGGYWLQQGPFGKNTIALKNSINTYGPVGFSLNGGHRNVGYIGKTSTFSRNGTPFRGVNAYGSGGCCGTYYKAQPVFNVNRVIALGDQYMYIKQSVLSTYGQLEKQYKWIHNGAYPNNWVQPIYTGNQTDTSSQGLYIQEKAASNVCNIKVNNTQEYEGNIIKCSPTLCQTTTAKFKFNDMARNAPYTKELKQPTTSGQYILYTQRKCTNPNKLQKPFPYAVNTGTGILTGGINVSNVGNACNTSDTYTVPPEWYIKSNSGMN